MTMTSRERISAFAFLEHGAHAGIYYQGDEILTFEKNHCYFGGHWIVTNQHMLPGGGPEVAFLPIFGWHGYQHAVTDVRYDTATEPDGLSVVITPTGTAAGTAAFELVAERCTITVRLEDGQFVWTQRMDAEVRQPIAVWALSQHTPLRVYRFWHADNRPGVFLQFADPAPVNASGPAVPMTRDWLHQPEPFGPDSFRAHWQRRYVAILLQNPDGSYVWSELNKTKWLHLTRDNRRARACHPQGYLYLLQEDGTALEYTCDAPSHFHHVCEWGMDFHFWMDLEPYLQDGVLPAGTTLTAGTTVRQVGPEVTQPIRAQARELTLTPSEFRKANLPAYEEPENTFTVSALERMDAQCWKPTSEGCRWETTGGYREGAGALVIRNQQSNIGSWEQPSLGPSQWGNPFLAEARYRFSAWVKVEECACDTTDGGPQLGVEFRQFNGPATNSTTETVAGGWSAPLITIADPIPERIPWTYVEVITSPCPSNVLVGKLLLRFIGRGTAYFSNVRWELLPPGA
ncbi:MAG TPA: hypothetical protein PLZ36_01490 [Armatimonadota bacterium]|nr:hypothetical protein [Armatimonadota bacterium]